MKIIASKGEEGRWRIKANSKETSLLIERSNEGGNGVEWAILVDNGDNWPEFLAGGIDRKDQAITAISRIAAAVAETEEE